jgi:hypothetical protein
VCFETVEKQEVGAEDTPFLRELSDDTDTPLDELEDGEFDELIDCHDAFYFLSQLVYFGFSHLGFTEHLNDT